MTTITQTITTLPTAPDPATMTPTEFSAAAAAYVLAQKGMVPELNTWAGQVNTVAGEVNTNAATSVASSNAAQAAALTAVGAANYVGAWASLTGAKTAGISVDHEGAFWLLLANVADVTAAEPGVSGSWGRLFGAGQLYERASNIELTAEDSGKIFKYTSGTFDQTFDAAATLGANWYGYFWNPGTGIITFNPDGSELIDGAATKILRKDCIVMVLCDGSAFTTIELALPVSDQHVIVTTGNGHGSTNTRIRRFTTTLSSAGNAITYADSGTDGGSFTINDAGLYEVFYSDGHTTDDSPTQMGISINSNQLTTGIQSITAANRIAFFSAYRGGVLAASSCSTIIRAAAGDVIRAHNGGDSLPDSTTAAVTKLSVRKVGP